MQHRVALSQACGIVAEAILEKLGESGLTSDSLVLLDEEFNAGKRIAFAGSHLPVQNQQDFDFSDIALLLMPVANDVLENAALEHGCLLASHVIDNDAPALFIDKSVADPGISWSESRLRLAGPELCCLLPVLLELERVYPIERVNLTLLRSVEFHGKAGVDELASQTINLLNARDIDASVFPQQIAFNLLPESAGERLGADLSHFLINISYPAMLQIVNIPVFHGFAAGVQLGFAADVPARDCRKLLASLDNVTVKNGPASPISDCNQSFSCVISHLEQAPDQPSNLQFWMITDPMRYGLANNYVNVTEFLLKSFL